MKNTEDHHCHCQINEGLDELKVLVDERLNKIIDGASLPDPGIAAAMSYSLLAGGKRLRPVMFLAVAGMFGTNPKDALEAACAIELVHTYTLVHDDLPAMDDDDFRRGRPTCHRVYGEATAILAGDALLTLAFELLAKFGLKDGDDHHRSNALRLIHELASAAGYRELICGQMMDLAFEGRDDVPPEAVEDIGRRKTAALICAATRMGAILGGATDEELERLSRYGISMGMAFQIVDDLLNIGGDPEQMGKKTGTDRDKGKATYPVLWGRNKAHVRVMELYHAAVGELEHFGSRADVLCQLADRIIFRQD